MSASSRSMNLPEKIGWEQRPIGSLFQHRVHATTAEEHAPLSVTKEGVIDQLSDVAVSEFGAPKKLVRAGDLVINSRSDRKGSSGLALRDGSVSVINTVLKPRAIDPGFAMHLLRSRWFQEEFYRFGSGIVADLWSTRYQAMKTIRIPVPNTQTQRAIADHLDHETAEIDRFIVDHERLSTLLAERRDAALARSVVNASSGSTLREVPWSPGLRTPYHVVNIRRAAAMRTGHTPNRSTAEYWEGDLDVPWFTLADVWQLRAGQKYLGKTKESISKVGLANSAAELLPTGTVVLSRTASVGFTGIMPQPMTTSQDFWNWVCSDHLLPEYLWLQFRAMRPFFDRIKSGSTHKTIYQADAAGMDIVLPPVEAQRAIINELSSTDATTEALIADCTRAIALAKERRAALITAAVTGQIDVTAKHRPAAEQLEDDIKELT